MSKDLKIVGLWDLHIPFHIDIINVLKFIHDFKPNLIILGGDLHDWTPASHWIANQSTELDGTSIHRCYEELHNVLLNPLLKAKPRDCQTIFLTGNHEDWLDQATRLNRNGRNYWELENNIDLKKHKMKILPVNMPYQVNENLAYIHGIYTNEYHAKKTVQAYHTSVFYSHTHDIQSYTQVSPIDSEKFYKGQSCGCLCHINPHYGRNKPNKWVNGFHYCYVHDKYFHDVQVVVVKGRFWANGKYY